MNQHTEPADHPAMTCATDKSCGPADGCGCGPAPARSAGRKRLNAAIVGLLCVVGCLAVPIAIGGAAALAGVLAGEAWLIIAGIAVASAGYVAKRRLRFGSGC